MLARRLLSPPDDAVIALSWSIAGDPPQSFLSRLAASNQALFLFSTYSL